MNNLQFAICNLQSPFLRLGLRMLNGLGEKAGRIIESARENGPFTSIDDFAHRTGLGQPVIKRLAEADAFVSVGADRRHALWNALNQEKKPRAMPLFAPNTAQDCKMQIANCKLQIFEQPTSAMNNLQFAICNLQSSAVPTLPPMPLREQVVADYRTTGLSLRAHPISFYREQLKRLGITPAHRLIELPNDAPVRVAGLVILRQRPGTAKGITFVTLEDETGTVNLVVHQQTWDRYYRIARRAPAWIAHGHIQTAPQSAVPIIHVVVDRLEALAEQLRDLDVKSRDFR
jgi:error-prone DNA polymerase